MPDLADFLTARLDADEWIAQGALRNMPGDGEWHPMYFGDGGYDARVDDHLARFDPARVLREVEAKRKLIDFAYSNAADVDGEWGDGHGEREIRAGLCTDDGAEAVQAVLGPLAAVYSDHPDFDASWLA